MIGIEGILLSEQSSEEYWINVYAHGKHNIYGICFKQKLEAIENEAQSVKIAYRIHVRLK